jgi:FkbM family methyltransferase
MFRPAKFIDALKSRSRERTKYGRTRDWALMMFNRVILRCPRALGLFQRKVCRVRLAGHDRPFFVRLGTSDWWVLEEIFLHGEYDVLNRVDLGPVRRVLDLGANCGFSIRLWQEQFAGAKIIAVEPDPDNVRLCRMNAGEDTSSVLTLIQACVAATERTVYLDRAGQDWGIVMRDEGAGGGSAVQTVTMARILSDWGAEAGVDLLKCDIEGAEAELFGACQPWIGRVRNLVVEVHEPYTIARLVADISSHGHRFEVLDETHKGPRATAVLQRVGEELESSLAHVATPATMPAVA